MEADDIANHYAAVAKHYQVLPDKTLIQKLVPNDWSLKELEFRGLSTPILQTVSTNMRCQSSAESTSTYNHITF